MTFWGIVFRDDLGSGVRYERQCISLRRRRGSKAFARNRAQRSVPWSMPWSISGQRGALGASIMFARSGSTNRRLSKTHRDRPRLHRRIKASRYTTLAAEHQLFLETVIVFGAPMRAVLTAHFATKQRTYGADP